MPIYVTPDELQRIKALSDMAKAFPDDASDIKAKKKNWWGNIRDKYDLGDEDKYKIGLDTGEIRLKNGAATDAPPPAPKYQKVAIPLASIESALDDGVLDDADWSDSTFPAADPATIVDNKLVLFVTA